MKESILKFFLIFGILGFATFLILIVTGMVMNALGFTCNCYTIFAWSLIGVAIASGFILSFGCCCKNKDCK